MRNVIMISTDQQQVSAMGCADPRYYTPNLDKLAQRSVRFTGAITATGGFSRPAIEDPVSSWGKNVL